MADARCPDLLEITNDKQQISNKSQKAIFKSQTRFQIAVWNLEFDQVDQCLLVILAIQVRFYNFNRFHWYFALFFRPISLLLFTIRALP